MRGRGEPKKKGKSIKEKRREKKEKKTGMRPTA